METIIFYIIIYFLIAFCLIILRLVTDFCIGQKSDANDFTDSIFWILYIIRVPVYFIKMFFNVVKIVKGKE